MAKSNADRVRSAAEQHVAARGKRYEPGLREQARAHGERRRRDGLSWQAIADELGVRGETLRRWCVGPTCRVPVLRPVQVVEPEIIVTGSQATTIVTSRNGLRVEGLSVADVIALVRAVG